ncbi:MAG: DUF1566 domain-containing protein [Candidatus Omnitrophica bacterium]|nr:DUF1566 domain-containing protein [Candidatus Omnitrophota bacterium]
MTCSKLFVIFALSLGFFTGSVENLYAADPCTGTQSTPVLIGQTCEGGALYAGFDYMLTPRDAGPMKWESAVAYCRDLKFGDFSSGWYLPTETELNGLLYSRRRELVMSSNYWSSTQNNAQFASSQNFLDGTLHYSSTIPVFDTKPTEAYVRCLRKF